MGAFQPKEPGSSYEQHSSPQILNSFQPLVTSPVLNPTPNTLPAPSFLESSLPLFILSDGHRCVGGRRGEGKRKARLMSCSISL